MRLFAGLALFLVLSGNALAASWSFGEPERLRAPEGLEFVRQEASDGTQRVTVHVVSFPASTHTFAVMDNPAGAFDLGSAAQKRGVLAAVNGGYFQRDRTPLGLVIRQGVTIHPLENARLLSGLVVVTKERLALLRTAEFKPGPSVREALQAGPFLIDGGKPVAGLNDTRAAARTVVFTDSSGRAGLLTARHATLADTAQILATAGLLPGAKVVRALNLDGGTSTALWVRQDSGAFYEREWKGVRNYLGIVPRAAP